ncbi:MAG: aminotransferase class V-fold PLP-dependent enzyme [Vicinamibacterales bacterium]
MDRIEYEAFVARHPEYLASGDIDALRASEFGRLDETGEVYLDYTGSGLYGASQVQRHLHLLSQSVLGNPHSQSPTSRSATELAERARRHVLDYFRASPDEYCAVFTGNASQALKLVGESYPFDSGSRLLLTFDNHNSVNGIREFARTRGAETTYVPVIPPDLRVDADAVAGQLARSPGGGHRLFAYPAQSNFSGVQHDLRWIGEAQAKGWDVLLDAAAFVPTNQLDLSRWKPDFVVLSFYKMFGYPTGVGALLARWPALSKLHRPWFAGGTIAVASVGADRYHPAEGAAAFEDGTVNFTSLPAVDIGLEFLESVGVDDIHARVQALTSWLIGRLLELRHSSGRPLVTLYGPASAEARGATVTLNMRDSLGGFIDHQVIEERAGTERLSIRSGCFCNPGAGELAMGISADEMRSCFLRSADRITYDEFRQCIDGKSTGAVRISLGVASTFADVSAFADFARSFLN